MSGQLRQKQCEQKILRGICSPYCPPVLKCAARKVHLGDRVRSQPVKGIVVIGGVPLFPQYIEGFGHVLQLNAGCRTSGFVEVLNVILANVSHFAVIKCSGESASLTGHAPVANSLINQKMEQSIIGSRNRTSKAGLLWSSWFQICQMVGLLQQVVSKRHILLPARFVDRRLLRMASEIKVREEPMLGQVDSFGQLPHNLRRDLT